MTPIFPSTALKNRQREIKELAETQVVYITENGHGKYVFTSQEVLDNLISDAVEQAMYEARMEAALKEAREDIAAGRVYESRESLMAAVAQKRASYA